MMWFYVCVCVCVCVCVLEEEEPIWAKTFYLITYTFVCIETKRCWRARLLAISGKASEVSCFLAGYSYLNLDQFSENVIFITSTGASCLLKGD